MGDYEEMKKSDTGVEKRNLRTLVIASAVIGVLSYFGMRTTWGLVAAVGEWLVAS